MSSNALQKLLDEVQTLHITEQVLKKEQSKKYFAIALLYAQQIPIADNKKLKRRLITTCIKHLKQALRN